MFAVPGWAISTDGPKAEAALNSTQGPKDSNIPKKRKRQSVASNVTTSNVADLWERVIEGKDGKESKVKSKVNEDQSTDNTRNKKGVMLNGAPRLTLKEKKKLKKQREDQATQNAVGHVTTDELDSVSLDSAPSREVSGEAKRRKKDNNSKGHKDGQGSGLQNVPQSSEPQAKTPTGPPAPKLTPMQVAMREKLVSARFRHLNETLYTKPSDEAFRLFQDSPEMFQEYHEGFRRQVNVWPENPVDGYIEDIELRGMQRHPHKPKPGHTGPTLTTGVHPLMRTSGACTIADLGCGDAKLATTLQSKMKKLNLNILSYDLQSPSPLVIRADIANLPLANGSVDVAIFCLALMGTNWLDFVEEAYRILRWKGELWVAEIKSRFGHVSGRRKNAPVNHSVGNRKKNQDKKDRAKASDAEPDKNHNVDLAVEVDGAEDGRRETDVTAFVEALQRRGFVLQGDEKSAIDMRNKMFVKMHFIKAAQPSVGKGVVGVRDAGRGGKKKGGVKFIDTEEQNAVDESAILKPSVYKVR
ncbi:putative methyltransferase-related protein [Rosellinia necatrix]|uniref:Ribosomal RNA-processing protein 8 n=1 Tax=Rosellinia necatrix TaxID=77044 RepID=A0A1W2TB40_ROSNE|nr:putative methyltransferase-related protein [Rosellinia necatrix]